LKKTPNDPEEKKKMCVKKTCRRRKKEHKYAVVWCKEFGNKVC